MKRIAMIVLVLASFYNSRTNVYGQDTIGYETSPFQITIFCPPFSSNGPDNANMVNNLSLNPFIGLSGGVDGVELGGFINIDRFFMYGFQAAGFGNTVWGNVEGVQVAGFYNLVNGDVRYMQGAGFININGGGQYGFQGAGFANVVGADLYGFQAAGFSNFLGGKVTGIQASGFINVAGDSVNGFQGSGFMNVAKSFDNGAQAAGFGNVAGEGKVQFQGAGFFNVADEVEGLQVAGFLNKAGYVKGLQVAGFINVCDSIDGVPIGFINIVKYNGYRRFQVATSETQFVSLAFKLGVEQLYSIYSVGKPFGAASRWMYGFGLGTQFPLSQRSFMNVEVQTNRENWIGDSRANRIFHRDRVNFHNQLSATVGMELGNFGEAFIGPTLNMSVAHTEDSYDPNIPWEPIAPNWAFFDRTYTNFRDTNLAMWIGFKGGIRF